MGEDLDGRMQAGADLVLGLGGGGTGMLRIESEIEKALFGGGELALEGAELGIVQQFNVRPP
jgi:hypothetical protein